MKSELEKFRSRWLRWLGQKTRCDKPYWTTLLNSNWIGWMEKVLEKHNFEPPSKIDDRDDVKRWFEIAILEADMSDLRKLDELYCTEKIK